MCMYKSTLNLTYAHLIYVRCSTPTTHRIAQLTVKEKVKEANKKWNAEYAFLNKGRRRMSLPTAEARAEDIRQALGNKCHVICSNSML